MNFAVERGGALLPILALGNSASDFPALGDFAGSLRVILSGASTLLGVGSFGGVQWGTLDSADSQGIWQIVAPSAAPEPGTLALLGLGLAGLAGSRRRHQ